MTDRDNGRIDLRAVDTDEGAADRVIGGAIGRIRMTPQLRVDPMEDMARRAVRPALIAASVLVAAAVFAVAFIDTRRAEVPAAAATVASWADSDHVPTNAELLQAFQGYAR
jgi:hypothetical protein